MSPARRKIVNFLLFTTTLILAAAICGVMYYYKIQQNQDYQNQLHFRELNEVSKTISTTIDQIAKITEITSEDISAPTDDILTYSGNRQESSEIKSALNRYNLSKEAIKRKKEEVKKRVELVNKSNSLKNLTYSPNKKNNLKSSVKSERLYIEIHKGNLRLTTFSGVFSTPLNDMISENLLLFPFVLLTDEMGNIKSQKFILKNDSITADLSFKNAQGLLVESTVKSNKSQDFTTKEYSKISEKEMGGILYNIYVQPINIRHSIQEVKQLYLIGITPQKKIRLAKLKISPAVAIASVLSLVALLAATPLIKLRFCSKNYSFTPSDISQLLLGSIILFGILSIASGDYFFSSYYQEVTKQQGYSLYRSIHEDFKKEIDNIVKQKDKFLSKNNESSCDLAINTTKQERKTNIIQFENCSHPDLLIKKNNENYYILEHAFELNHKGIFAPKHSFLLNQNSKKANELTVEQLLPSYWLKPKLYPLHDISLKKRNYFKNATSCDLWYLNEKSKNKGNICQSGLFIERIYNIRDGRKSTQFSFSLFANKYEKEKNRKILSLGSKMRTFFNRVMPPNFGYIVFNNNGDVLYHDKDERSLVENIFIETNNDSRLYALIKHQQNPNAPTSFKTNYRNSQHLFFVGKLHKNIPWNLAIYHKQTPLLLENMILVFISTGLFIGIIIPLFLWCRYGTNQTYWREILRYNPSFESLYPSIALSIFSLNIILLFSLGITHQLSFRLIIWLLAGVITLFCIRYRLTHEKSIFKTPLLPLMFSLTLLSIISYKKIGITTFEAEISGSDLISFFFALTAIVFLLFSFKHIKNKLKRRELCLLTKKCNSINGYTWYCAALWWLAALIPSIFILNSANKYLLLHQSYIHSEHLKNANAQYITSIDNYLVSMGIPKEKFQYEQWLTTEKLSTLYSAKNLDWIHLPPDSKTSQNTKELHIEPHDFIIESLIKSIFEVSELNSDRLYFSTQKEKEDNKIYFHPDGFFQFATTSQFIFTIMSTFLLVLLSQKTIKIFFVKKLLGEVMPNSYRVKSKGSINPTSQWLKNKLEGQRKILIQIIQPNTSKIVDLTSSHFEEKLFFNRAISIINLIENVEENKNTILTVCQSNQPECNCIIIQDIELALSNKEARKSAFYFIKSISEIPNLHVIILCETTPLYKICHQDSYSDFSPLNIIEPNEKLEWGSLLSQFEKHHDYIPHKKKYIEQSENSLQILQYETNGWDELHSIKREFKGLFSSIEPLAMTNLTLSKHWNNDQIIEYFFTHASELYQYKWQQCTQDEKLLLYQIANGYWPNPANIEALEHLTRKGYLYRDRGWHIVNFSFQRFVRTAEKQSDMTDWLESTNTGIWQWIRLPIMVVTLVLIVLVLRSSGEGVESILAILTALLGLIPLLLRNFSGFNTQQISTND
ncbi:hypothetical protein [Marinibactrum halimedae]|uniref:Uncharacterized protein n=1 Tax=Marinibactrum halimedae TaxID=1444977 RepID=A0AA37T147_9GAMM|nr:hypothetical protein [Marinibactrum halimedae]MCD9460677.1 hypothetical protein [Marinibactrum halimedae]GLS24323.1 hypothetical protein GCM10007877_00340 [Marinibactrum halimedae]